MPGLYCNNVRWTQKQNKSMGGSWLISSFVRFIKLLESVQIKWDVSLLVNKHTVIACSHLSSTALKGASPLWELVSLIIARSCTGSLGPPPLTFLSLCSFLFLSFFPPARLVPFNSFLLWSASKAHKFWRLYLLCSQFPVGGNSEAGCVKYSAVICLFTVISLWIAVICR